MSNTFHQKIPVPIYEYYDHIDTIDSAHFYASMALMRIENSQYKN